MQRLLLILAVAALLLEVYGIVSCALMPADRVRTLPKWAWLLVVILLPLAGPILWVAIGRERATRTAPRGAPAPDDDPDRFGVRRIPQSEQDRRIAQLEAELAALDSEGDQDGDTSRRPRG